MIYENSKSGKGKSPHTPHRLHCLKRFAIMVLIATVTITGIFQTPIAFATTTAGQDANAKASTQASQEANAKASTQASQKAGSDASSEAGSNTGSSAGMLNANPVPGYEPDAGNGKFQALPLPDQIPPLPGAADASTYNLGNQPNKTSRAATLSAKSQDIYVRVTSSVGINVRKGAGTNYGIIGKLPFNERVKYLGKKTASDKSIWYKIQCDFGIGYGHSDYLEMEKEYQPSQDFESSLTQQGFPESYKKLLRQIHASYPNWRFIGDDTGLNWNTVIEKETNPVSINLVSHIRPDTWKSVEPGAYNPATNQYISYDSGGWVPADYKVVKYFMDPRNFLNSGGIFQFMSNKYDSATATPGNVAGVTAGTFMDARFPEKVNGQQMTYNQVICDIGKKSGVNPMVIASIIIQEQGANGGGRSISGKEAGFKGIYNHWNIGAYQTSSGSAVTNGLRYAKSHGWNSRYKSILGGAQWFAGQYVNNNKYNSYLKKFNVMNRLENVGRGQYMTNIEAAYHEGLGLRNGYVALVKKPLVFTIPIYRNMPDSPCQMPVDKGSHINFLKSMSIRGVKANGQLLSGNLSLSPKFDPRTSQYKVTVPDSATKVQFSYKGSDPSVKVSIAGANKKNQVSVPIGTTTVKVKVTATSTRYRYYKVALTRRGGANTGGQQQKPQPVQPSKPPKVTGISLDSDFGLVKVSYKASSDSKVSAYRISYRQVTGTKDDLTYSPWKQVDTNKTSILLDGLKINAHYQVRVAAVNEKANLCGDYSKEFDIYSNRNGTRYAAPYRSKIENITGAPVKSTSAAADKTSIAAATVATKAAAGSKASATVTMKNIKYSKPPKTVTYRIRYKEKGATKWKYVSSTSNVRTITGLTNGKTYTFEAAYRYTSPLDQTTQVKLPFMSPKTITIRV